MKKKYLALCIGNLFHLGQFIKGNEFLIEKICDNFEKIFLINTDNLRFLKDKNNNYNNKDFSIDKKNSKLIIKNKKLKLPKNIKFFNPQNIKDFKNFMEDKNIIAINAFGRTFNDLKIHFLFKYFKIKQVQISNIGNLQTQITPIKKLVLKAWYHKVIHDLGHKVTVILSNIKLVPKIDIKFTSNKKQIALLKRKNLFKKLNLFYCKEHILVNSKSFDFITSTQPIVNKKKIILLDIMFNHQERIAMGSKPNKILIKDFYKKMNKLLNYLTKTYKKEVVVCIHPKDDLNKKKSIFKDYKVVKYASQENIFKAFLVFFFDTSAIVDAIILKKRIFVITSRAMDKNQISQANDYHKSVGIPKLDIDAKNILNKKIFSQKISVENYSNYIKNYIEPDGKNLGYEKITKTIKNRFF